MELTYELYFSRERIYIGKTRYRKFYFLNEEGRGLFNQLTDISEKNITLDKGVIRLFSSSIIFKSNENEKYRYFLNFESNKFNLELLDLETEEVSFYSIKDNHVNYSYSWIQMLKYGEKNQIFVRLLFLHLYR